MPNDARIALPVGSRLNHDSYLIEAELGAGGFGITYRARDENLHRVVAIKEFFPAECLRRGTDLTSAGSWTDADLDLHRERFLEEGRALARLSHPGIVKVYNVFRENSTVYLVMEYLEGQTLKERLKAAGNRLPVDEALGYVRQAGEALTAVHTAGLLHRDIKPDNLLLTAGGQVVLIDFGSARPTTQDGRFYTRETFVSDGYSPLENYDFEGERDCRSDIYSLAATLYYLVTGIVPTHATGRANRRPLIEPYLLYPDIQPAFSAAIVRGLALHAEDRPATVTEFLSSLVPTASSHSSNRVIIAPPTPAPSPPTVRRAPLVLPQPLLPDLSPPVSATDTIRRNPGDGAEMVWIPADSFLMGGNRYDNEHPVHKVMLSGFWMYRTPVTVAQFRKYDEANGRQYDWEQYRPAWGWHDDHPMVAVNWEEASGYARWGGGALPTEAQWERAARGGLEGIKERKSWFTVLAGVEGLQYPWGEEWDGEQCASSVRPSKLTGSMPAGSFPANAFGLYDMVGNVWEWCADWYDVAYYKTESAHNHNPTGPSSGTSRVLRGGSWSSNKPTYLRCAYRDYLYPDYRVNFIGFRCCSV